MLVSLSIAAIWIVASVVCLPRMLPNNYVEDATKYPCNRPWTLNSLDGLKKTYIVEFCFLFMVTPAVVILFCYLSICYRVYFKGDICPESPGNIAEEESKKGLLRLPLSLAVAFVFCLLLCSFSTFLLFQRKL